MANILDKNGQPEHRHNPAVFWLLIIFLMLAMGASIKLLAKPEQVVSQVSTPAPTESREPRIYTVLYSSGVFSPTNLRIHAGDTVRFKNESFFGIRIVSDSEVGSKARLIDSVGDIPQGSYFSYTFAEKGTFGYHNDKSPEEQGTIIVR